MIFIQNCIENAVHQQRLNLQSMIVGVFQLYDKATQHLVEKALKLYYKRYIKRKYLRFTHDDKWLNESYGALKLSIDTNFIIYLIPNISTINQQSQINIKNSQISYQYLK
ncbi:unnamed protein product [Paramecium primaurelia]|uniref:Uncharacterized protein n=1 Tax=Paramecium primaurelia TaxID=5886 RepID=A0A8S1LV64_PARPR|nr:unnamed protein product [Paramecium primaurelia]